MGVSILLAIASIIAAEPIIHDESIIMFEQQESFAQKCLAYTEEWQELSTELIHDCTKSFVVTRAEFSNRRVLTDNTQSQMYFKCRRDELLILRF